MYRSLAVRTCLAVLALTLSATVARATPTQAEVFRGIQDGVGQHDSISTKGMVATGAVVGGIVIVALTVNHRRHQQELAAGGWGSATSDPTPSGRRRGAANNHPGKLVRELMKEAGLTRAQVRQLEALNERLAADDRDVRHLATLLLCPSLIASARPEPIVRAG